jgi:hypothetical protein
LGYERFWSLDASVLCLVLSSFSCQSLDGCLLLFRGGNGKSPTVTNRDEAPSKQKAAPIQELRAAETFNMCPSQQSLLQPKLRPHKDQRVTPQGLP